MKKIKLLSSLVAVGLLVGCGSNNSNVENNTTNNQPNGIDSNVTKAMGLVINEFKSNISQDVHAKQYIELRGEPNSVIENTYLVVLDGDEEEEGHVDYALNLNGKKVGANGLIIIKNADEYNDVVASETTVINEALIKTYVDDEDHEDGLLEHDAITYALINSTTEIKSGDDLDSDNDGKLELPSGATLIDSVGNLNGGDGFVYSSVVLVQSASDADAATRFYDDTTPNSLSAWANGDVFEDPTKEDEELPDELLYDALSASSNLPPRAALTPGDHNFKKAPFALLNEVVTSGEKYVEVLSNAAQSFQNIALVALSDNKVVLSIDLSALNAKETGITVIKDKNSNIAIGSASSSMEADLSHLSSEVALVYSSKVPVVGESLSDEATILDTITASTGAAIRYKDNKMSSMSAWNFEAKYITPAHTNIAADAKLLVQPTLETSRTIAGSADADDIAFWINPTNATQSLIIGTQKNAGYSIYDTNSNTLTDVKPEGIRYNNVDVIYGFMLKGELVDLAIFSDRYNNKFAIYKITAEAPYLTDVTDPTALQLFDSEELGEDTVYGLAVYQNPATGKTYAYGTRNGYNTVAQFELIDNNGKITWNKVRTMTLEADDEDKYAEGMVVDQEYGKLYIAQEEVGLYSVDALPNEESLALTEDDLIIEEGDHGIVADLEGLTIYYKDNGEGYLMISSQGNNVYGVFNRTAVGVKNEYINSFTVVATMEGIDGTQETDSIDVTNFAISSAFPYGAFIAQDGLDTTSDPDNTQTNFKWIAWESIASKLGDTDFTSNYNPRTPTNRR